MSSARETAVRALLRADEFLGTTPTHGSGAPHKLSGVQADVEDNGADVAGIY